MSIDVLPLGPMQIFSFVVSVNTRRYMMSFAPSCHFICHAKLKQMPLLRQMDMTQSTLSYSTCVRRLSILKSGDG